MRLRIKNWRGALRESAWLAFDSIRSQPARSTLAMLGIVIGIITVVLVASVLANVRNSHRLLFRELGTENVFAFHLTGDPYSPASEQEARRKPLKPEFAAANRAADATAIREVAVQLIVPPIVNGRALTARAAARTSRDTVLVEGASAELLRDRRGRSSRPAGRSRSSRTARPRTSPSSAPAWRARCLAPAPSVGKTIVAGSETPTSSSARRRRARAAVLRREPAGQRHVASGRDGRPPVPRGGAHRPLRSREARAS